MLVGLDARMLVYMYAHVLTFLHFVRWLLVARQKQGITSRKEARER
jgi:hypothetical protein